MTGTEYGELIASKKGADREAALCHAVQNDQLPSIFYNNYRTITSKAVIDGKERVLQMRCAADFLAAGTDADPFYVGGWTSTAQQIADYFHCILPSEKIARLIYEQADLRVPMPNPGEPWYDTKNHVPRNIEDSGAWIAANKKHIAALGPIAGREKKLVAGHMKDILQTKSGLLGSCPASLGGCLTLFGALQDGKWPVQGVYKGHQWNYGPDYSHGIRLVHREALLDGVAVDLFDIFKDPKLCVLVTTEGPYVPWLPSPTAGGPTGCGPGGGSGGGGSSKPPGGSKAPAEPVDTRASPSLLEAAAPFLALGFIGFIAFKFLKSQPDSHQGADKDFL